MQKERLLLLTVMLCLVAVTMCTSMSLAQANDAEQKSTQAQKNLGIFVGESSVGQTPTGVKAEYDATRGAYRITGGGANVWGTADAFYFVWKKSSGDMTLSAAVEWVGSSNAQHRKAFLMVRQSLDPASAYADAVLHGNGLTALQFRGAANEQT